MPLPLVPLRVGLVTSRGSAAHADTLAELRASGIGFSVLDADARTQGLDAPGSVVRAVRAVADRHGAELQLGANTPQGLRVTLSFTDL